MRRALERAGNRVKAKAGPLRAMASQVHPMQAAAVVGRTLLADAGLDEQALLADAWDDLVVVYRHSAQVALDDAMGLAGTFVGEWRVGTPEAIKATFQADLAASEAYLRRGMQQLGEHYLFDPKGVLVPDPLRPEVVPTGFVRHITALAGGDTPVDANGGAWVAIQPNGKPVGGIATGPTVMGALQQHGAVVEAFRWVYGPAQRGKPFHPHQRLDGRVFENFDDPVLAANPSTWPYVAFYVPGDHDYCKCDAEPIVLSADEARANGLL